jgi:hypothetical protein
MRKDPLVPSTPGLTAILSNSRVFFVYHKGLIRLIRSTGKTGKNHCALSFDTPPFILPTTFHTEHSPVPPTARTHSVHRKGRLSRKSCWDARCSPVRGNLSPPGCTTSRRIYYCLNTISVSVSVSVSVVVSQAYQ